jgi:hypothetical protein
MSRKPRTLLLLLILTAIGSVGCGKEGHNPSATPVSPVASLADSGGSSRPKGSQTTLPSARATTTTLTRQETRAGGDGGTTRATTTTEPLVVPTNPDKRLPMTAVLDQKCVPRGTKQGITIRTEPNAAVGYDSVYPDGHSGADKEGFYGGNNGSIVPASGEWKDTWLITANAPPGEVIVRVLGTNNDGYNAYLELHFKLTASPTEC